jgi:hypothetical protein
MPKRIDANQREIVAACRACGATVLILSNVGKGCPDLLIGYHGVNYLVEIKDGSKPPSQQKLTPAERLFFDSWRGKAFIIRTVNDAIRLLKGELDLC